MNNFIRPTELQERADYKILERDAWEKQKAADETYRLQLKSGELASKIATRILDHVDSMRVHKKALNSQKLALNILLRFQAMY